MELNAERTSSDFRFIHHKNAFSEGRGCSGGAEKVEIVTFFSESLSVICTGRARVWRDEQIYVGRQVLMMCIYLGGNAI